MIPERRVTVYAVLAMVSLVALLVSLITGCVSDHYTLIGCNRDFRFCQVFNSNTGDLELRGLPLPPAALGQQEVSK